MRKCGRRADISSVVGKGKALVDDVDVMVLDGIDTSRLAATFFALTSSATLRACVLRVSLNLRSLQHILHMHGLLQSCPAKLKL